MRSRLLLGLAIILGTGCVVTTAPGALLQNPALIAGETHQIWSRPNEVGFDIDETDIQGEATSKSVLWGLVYNGTSRGAASAYYIDATTGQHPKMDDPLVRAAASDAVAKENGADGIYITQVSDSGTMVLWGLYTYRKVTVRGRPLKLKVYGPVDQQRADRSRFLRDLGNGHGLIQIPPDAVQTILK